MSQHVLIDGRDRERQHWRALAEAMTQALPGCVDFSDGARALYATDASNYRQPPIGVVTPRSRDDVVAAVRIARAHGAPIVSRGGGTSLAGQGCNDAVLIDFSRHLDRVLWLDADARLACVEPGCILDTLRGRAEEHGMTFGPDPATHDHNTLGGMIGNNSCGAHSLMSGRTSDYVERLTVLTYDGEILDVGPTPDHELTRLAQESSRQSVIYRDMIALRDRYGALIEARYPDIPRRVSGFENLDALFHREGFNVAKALTGTEGACVLVLEATVKLIESPRYRALALLAYPDIFEAADPAADLRSSGAIAVEAFDGRLRRDSKPEGFPDGGAWLIVETGGQTKAEASAAAHRIAHKKFGAARTRVVDEPDAQQRIWRVREGALADAAKSMGEADTWPGWEDSAVAPERLGEYLRALDRLMRAHGYAAAFYGHFGGGLVHCRLNFDFSSDEGVAKYRAFMRDAAKLVVSFGGSLSGEHGDGQARAELLEIMYGRELVQCFAAFKAIWDPNGKMNPGKAINAYPMDANLRLGPHYHPPQTRTHFTFAADDNSFAKAVTRCVGVGKCRRTSADDEVMCPSYIVTREEKHSTRGRAHLLHEMLRQDVITSSWRSEAVEDALSLCLACKGCRRDCPVGVDMALYKSEFRAHHYAGKLRPRAAFSMGHIHLWAGLAEHAPSVVNALLASGWSAPLLKYAAGIHAEASPPRFATRSFRKDFKATAKGGAKIVLWADTFNNAFSPEVLHAAARVLGSGGYDVQVPAERLCCGRPLYDWGFLDAAKRLWKTTLDGLDEAIATQTPIVVLEPACASAFKDELPALMPFDPRAARLAALVTSIESVLPGGFGADATVNKNPVQFKPHCHQHAVLGVEPALTMFSKLGLTPQTIGGCCGMAGAFGLARDSYDVGRRIGEQTLAPLADHGDATIIADGFSCREQIARISGRKAVHMAQFLDSALQREA